MLTQVICGFLILFPVNVWTLDRNSKCITPSGELAICKSVRSCKPILDAISSRKLELLEFIKASQCGYDAEPLVCCGTVVTNLILPKCITPNLEEGRCGTESTCKVFEEGTTNGSPEFYTFLGDSTCDLERQLVCCGTKGEYDEISPLLPSRVDCGRATVHLAVVGGSRSKLTEYPWMALLGYKNTDGSDAGFRCGGSVINQKYILTAAHCVLISERQGFTLDIVRVGEWKISTKEDCEGNVCASPVQDIKIAEIIPHKLYNPRIKENDIALLRLDKEIGYTGNVQPICLPQPNKPEPDAGKLFDVIGWGATEDALNSDYKLSVKVPIIARSDCREKMKRRGNITENHVCAGGKIGEDSCQGDSGGPLIGKFDLKGAIQHYQEGVVSWGVGCGFPDLPAVYTRVSRYVGWIVDNLKP